MRKLFLLSEIDTQTINHTLQELHKKCAELVVLSADPDLYLAKPLHHAKGLLGHTLQQIILDCRNGFPLDYFLCAANTICNHGSFILIPPLSHYDEQSTRFHTHIIDTHHFQDYLAKGLQQYAQPFHIDEILDIQALSIKSQHLNDEQTNVINLLNVFDEGIITLFAPRGTGKSFVTAAFIQTIIDDHVITAPNQTALNNYKNVRLNFKAPDYLFLNPTLMEDKSWLIIEEAAQIPIAHLEKLTKLAKKVLLVSSIENYEGTGKGLAQKLKDIIPIQQSLKLIERHRFETHDPLAQFCDYISFNQISLKAIPEGCTLYIDGTLNNFQNNTQQVQSFYQFMNQYHYQTNVQDIRRLLDVPEQAFVLYSDHQRLIGGLWALEEGKLTTDLAQDIYNGYRRPKGNLVVQTLGAHSYYPELMTLKSLRISRIAVESTYRHQGIAKKMLTQLIKYATRHQYDFISTSFGLTESLLIFWQQCGFTWIHMGSHRDKTTGLHAAILIYPISKEMQQKVQKMKNKWQNDAFHLTSAPFIHKSTHKLLINQGVIGLYDELDKALLHAHEHHKKPFEATFSAQKRLKDSLEQ